MSNDIMLRDLANVIVEYIEWSMDEREGKHAKMVYPDAKLQSALRKLKKDLR